MPALDAANVALLQTRPLGRNWSIYVYQPLELWRGTVGGAPAQGDRELTVATVSGDPTDLQTGMTIRVTDSLGNPKTPPLSKVRFKLYIGAGPTLRVAENAIPWVAGDIVYGMRLFEPWPRIPWIDPETGVQYKDRTNAWISDANAQRPKANAGPACIANLVGGQADTVFKDEGSFDCPDGNAIGTWQWAALPAVGSGDPGAPTVVAGAENAATVTYRWTTAGYYYVSLTVTDANAMTGIVYVPVIIDDGTLARGYAVPGDRGWANYGWTLSRRLVSLLTVGVDTAWFDGAPVFLVADTQATAPQAFFDNRSNLRWSGWLKEDTTRRDAYGRGIDFRAISTAHVMSQIPAYRVRLNSEAAPTDWYGYTNLSVESAAYLLFLWHFSHWICDYYPTPEDEWVGGAGARARPGENAHADNILDQINGVLHAANANLRCGRQGELHVMRHEWLLSAAEQAGRATVMTLANQDIQEVTYGPRQHQARTREVIASGVDGTSTPYLAGAPGASPLDGGRPSEISRLSPKTAAELRQWAGQQLALDNWDAMARVTMSGEYDAFDPARGEFVAGTLSSFDSRIPDGPYSIESARFRDDHRTGVTVSELTLLPDPDQYPAEDRPIPESPEPPPPDDLPIDDYPPLPEPGVIGWPTEVYFGTKTLGVYYTDDFVGAGDPGQPTWEAVNDGLGATDVRQMGIDVHSATYRQFCLLETARDLYRLEDRENGGTWETILTNAAARTVLGLAGGYIMYFSVDRGVDGTMYALFAYFSDGGADGIYYLKCTDYTADTPAWTGGNIRLFAGVAGDYNNVGNIIAIDGNVYVCYNVPGGGNNSYADSSHNSGLNWTQSPTLGIGAWKPTVHCDPFNAGYCWANGNGAGGPDLVKVQDAAALVVYQNALNIGPLQADVMWFGSVANLQRILKADRIYETTDGWTSASNAGVLSPGATQLAEYVSDDDDFILLGILPAGAQDHHILALLGPTDLTPVGRAGTNAGAAPYTDSIPETAGGPSSEAIQVVR